MTEIYENRVCYLHDGRETTKDSFMFSLSDGSNDRFTVIPGDGRGQYTVHQSQPQVDTSENWSVLLYMDFFHLLKMNFLQK